MGECHAYFRDARNQVRRKLHVQIRWPLTVISSASEINLPGGRVRNNCYCALTNTAHEPYFFSIWNRRHIQIDDAPRYQPNGRGALLNATVFWSWLRSYAWGERSSCACGAVWMTFFLAPQPIPSCVSEDRPAKYEVISAGEFVKSRLEDAYGNAKKWTITWIAAAFIHSATGSTFHVLSYMCVPILTWSRVVNLIMVFIWFLQERKYQATA